MVIQEPSAGLNPKVNQLITLARAARHPLLLISDSNVRVGPTTSSASRGRWCSRGWDW